MSYYFNMYFKQFNNELDAFHFANLITNKLAEGSVAEEYMQHNLCYRPTKLVESTDIAKVILKNRLEELWIKNLFTCRFVYWKEEKLLGLCCDKLPEELEQLFDTSKSFQNSTDRDYPYEDWSDKINIFKREKDELRSLDDETLISMLTDPENVDYDEEELKEYKVELEGYKRRNISLDYYRLSYLYEKIFEQLQLDDWLYDNDNEAFDRWQFSSIKKDDTLYSLLSKFNKMSKDADISNGLGKGKDC